MGYVLVVDDDSAVQTTIVSYLADNNVRTESASTRLEMRRQIAASRPKLIILDPWLGQETGFSLLTEIRTQLDVPVIITTSPAADEAERIIALELGADHYIAKPFSLRELYARVRAVLRRQELSRATIVRDADRGGYRFNGWRFERRGRRLTDPIGTKVALGRSECSLLLAFLKSPQRVLSREDLLRTSRRDHDVFDRSIDICVMRLRRKLERPTAPPVIKTMRGFGYIFNAAVEPL
jgi:DNA-binding response OmpR family regulator